MVSRIRFTIAAIALLTIIPLFSQPSINFELGMDGGLGINYRFTKAVDDYSESEKWSRNKREVVSFLPQFGAHFSWLPNEKWNFQGGLRWTSRGFESKPFQQAHVGIQPPEQSYSKRVSYLEIPLSARYTYFQFKDWKLFASAGFACGFKLDAKYTENGIYTTHTESNTYEDNSARKFMLNLFTAAGLNYAFHSKFNLDFSLEYQQSILPAYEAPNLLVVEYDVKTYFWTLIPKIGVNYKL